MEVDAAFYQDKGSNLCYELLSCGQSGKRKEEGLRWSAESLSSSEVPSSSCNKTWLIEADKRGSSLNGGAGIQVKVKV